MSDGEQLDAATIAVLRIDRKRPVYAGDNWHGTPDPRQPCAHEHKQQLYSDRDWCQDCGKPVRVK